MPKTKLTITDNDAVKLPLALELSNGTLNDLKKRGPKLFAVVDYRDSAGLVELGRLLGGQAITDADVKQFNGEKEAEAKAAAAAEAKASKK